jgi:hypothetical protein
VQQHVQNVLYLPYRASSTDNDNIKWALQNYGGVYAAMYIDTSQSYYNSQTAAYYYSGSADPNHAVTIVGWDDSYLASNFPNAPPGPGAFIVKNSWGTSFGKSGFFYISYYDTQFARRSQPPAVFTAESTANYDNNYQYDPLGWVNSYGSGGSTAWGANVFTATSNQRLSAVSFYAGSVNTQYEIYVYTDPTSGPTGGTRYTGPAGTIAMPGYHTIPLTTPVSLTAGHKFSVVIKITTPGNNYPIPVENTWQGYSTGTAQSGQSYLSTTGTSWTDATQVDSTMNVCIKAFTTKSGSATQLSLTADKTAPAVNEQVTFTATLKSGTTPVSSKLVTIYHFENGNIIYDGTPTTDGNGQVTLATSWSTPGQRTYYAIFEGDTTAQTSTSSAVNINVGQTQLSLTASTTTPTVGTSVTFTATLKSGTTPVSSKHVTIYHFENGNIVYDGTPTTNSNGQVTLATSWSTTGQRTYYAIFEGDTTHQTSTSSAVIVNVNAWTSVTLTATTTSPTVGTSFTLTAKLYWLNPATGWVTVPSGKSVAIYHNTNGVIVYDGTRTTNSNGQITYTTSLSTTGQRTYYAIFDGDASYKWSMGSVTITPVSAWTSVTLTATTTIPTVNQQVTLTATLYWLNTATGQWVTFSGKSVSIYHDNNGVIVYDGTRTTNSNGQITLTTSLSTTGQRTYYAIYGGDASYKWSMGSATIIAH